MDNVSHNIVPDSLVVENVFVSAARKDILTGVTIRADKGRITGLLGRNGSGKTTMLKCMFGTRRAQECDIFLNGRRVKRPYTVNGLVNYLPQKPFLPKHLTIAAAAASFKVAVADICERFPSLAAHINARIADLPGGLERLCSVLLILLADTRFSLLDEPFSHIMPVHVEQLKMLIARQKQKKGIIITDHLYNDLLSLSDQVYLVKEGKSIFIRDMDELVLHGYLRHIEQ
jgi:ABC-type multidrug transport system ATPase subunit